MRLGVDDVGAGAAAEPAGGFVVADEDTGVVLAVAVLDPDRVALLEPVSIVASAIDASLERKRPRPDPTGEAGAGPGLPIAVGSF